MQEGCGVAVDGQVAVRLGSGAAVLASQLGGGCGAAFDFCDPCGDLGRELAEDLPGGAGACLGERVTQRAPVVEVPVIGGAESAVFEIPDAGGGPDEQPFRVTEGGDDPLVSGNRLEWREGGGRQRS